MHVILLSGGSGTRLWPLSNDIRSKQFIRLFRRPDGGYESMVQRMYRGIREIDRSATVTVATSEVQVSAIRAQLGEEVGISVEPARRDTFPAIALACLYLKDILHVGPEEPVVVCPVDPYVEDDYFEALKRLADRAEREEAKLVLMGIEPTYPSERYGYIIPESSAPTAAVKLFREKPTAEVAAGYIAQGGLWNGGVFAFRLGYLLEKTRELTGHTAYHSLFDAFADQRRISFDYAVVEHEPSIQVQRFHGEWKDIGTWDTLTEVLPDTVVGIGVADDACTAVQIINETDVPVLAMGLKDVVIAASPDGILVAEKRRSPYIRPYADRYAHEARFTEEAWGSQTVIDAEGGSRTVKVTIHPGGQLPYHSHEGQTEVWTIISGSGFAIISDARRALGPGDVITIAAGEKHTITAETEMKLIVIRMAEVAAEDTRCSGV